MRKLLRWTGLFLVLVALGSSIISGMRSTAHFPGLVDSRFVVLADAAVNAELVRIRKTECGGHQDFLLEIQSRHDSWADKEREPQWNLAYDFAMKAMDNALILETMTINCFLEMADPRHPDEYALVLLTPAGDQVLIHGRTGDWWRDQAYQPVQHWIPVGVTFSIAYRSNGHERTEFAMVPIGGNQVTSVTETDQRGGSIKR